jgi:hypothetical protein
MLSSCGEYRGTLRQRQRISVSVNGHQHVSLNVSLGMAIAWGISTILDLRSIRAAFLWRHGWTQEDVEIDIEDEGIRVTNSRGSGFIRWDSGVVVRLSASCFVVEEEGDDIVVIPKRYLNATELLMLKNKCDRS